MRKSYFIIFLACVGVMAAFQSCRNDEYLTTPLPTPDQSFIEEFDTVSSSLNRGWKIINVSVPKGSGIWQQAGSVNPWFSPYSSNGTYAGFIGAGYESVLGGPGTISNWLISPVVTMQNGDKIIFYTRSWSQYDGVSDTTDFGNSLQLRLNANNESLNVGQGTNPGDFSTSVLDINPTLIYSSTKTPNPNAYPTSWTRFEGTVYGLNGPTKGRFAFRYYVTDAGLCATCNGNGVGIDKVEYRSIKK
ncbi:MAG TPA: choice-of-anchor J domain-containing protein [Flavisolibacter sp.]|jgi:hypothetical protein|nr:choice-of-anchor J domain-containing protein [Flavisolibacter sp.]